MAQPETTKLCSKLKAMLDSRPQLPNPYFDGTKAAAEWEIATAAWTEHNKWLLNYLRAKAIIRTNQEVRV